MQQAIVDRKLQTPQQAPDGSGRNDHTSHVERQSTIRRAPQLAA